MEWEDDVEEGSPRARKGSDECSCICCAKCCLKGISWLLSKVSITQLWSLLALLTLLYFSFGNSISYQQSVEAAYQIKYAALKTQRDELIALERYWAIEIEGMKKEEQRQLLERSKLEQRAEDLRERERYVAEQMRKESEQHTPFQENGPAFVNHILQTKCGVQALTNYTTMHRLRRLGNLKPSHLILTLTDGNYSLAEKLAAMANGFAVAFQLNRAFFVDNSTFGSLFPLLGTASIDWQLQPILSAPPAVLDVRPADAGQRQSAMQTALGRVNAATEAGLRYSTTPLGALEALHALAQAANLSGAWHGEVGCILHRLIAPAAPVLGAMRDHLAALSDPETFTVAIYAPHSQLLRYSLSSLFACARNVVRYHALHGSRVRWFLVSDAKKPAIPEDLQQQVTQVAIGSEEADVVALYTLAYSRVRILTEGLLGRLGALLSLRLSATYHMPTNSKCGAEDTTRLDDLEFTYP